MLEMIAAFLAGWLGKKVKRFGEAMLDATWWLMRLTPPQRCYFFMLLYEKFLAGLCADLDAGRLRERERQAALRLISWLDPRLKAWQYRVRSSKTAV